MSYLIGAVSLLLLGLGFGVYRSGRSNHELRTDAVVGMIVGADLMVVSISLVLATTS